MTDWTDEYLQLVVDCEQRERALSSWDHDFIVSIRERLEAKRPLSPKQVAVLEQIWERATARG